ncbi:MAG: hypothetical protein ACR2PT_21495 [Endozoicomonas sp.]
MTITAADSSARPVRRKQQARSLERRRTPFPIRNSAMLPTPWLRKE